MLSILRMSYLLSRINSLIPWIKFHGIKLGSSILNTNLEKPLKWNTLQWHQAVGDLIPHIIQATLRLRSENLFFRATLDSAWSNRGEWSPLPRGCPLNVTLESIRDSIHLTFQTRTVARVFFPWKIIYTILPLGYESYGKCLKKSSVCVSDRPGDIYSRSTNSYTPVLIRLGIHLEEHLQILHHRLARR